MRFEINFNREDDNGVLKELGVKYEYFENHQDLKYEPYGAYMIEINTFEELEQLLNKVNKIKNNKFYSAIISFDPATIYFDNEV